MSEQIAISRKITNQLLHLAQQSPDQEVCGLLGGHQGIARTCYPISNSAETPQQRFLLDATEQIAAMTQMRECGEQLFAIYHSHPNAAAYPSIHDRQLIGYVDVLHLIISLNTQGILEMRGFKIDEKTTQEVLLELSHEHRHASN
jgi:proteasome lid subunit RPN8/RPN11